MKQIFLIITMLLSIFSLPAQDVQIDRGNHPDFHTEITKIMRNLNMSAVTSGILLDKGFPFMELANYQNINST